MRTLSTKQQMQILPEIQLAKIALDNSQKQEVKDFGNRMITDHWKAGDELKPIAQEMNVTLPQKVSAERQTSKRVWQPGSGSHGA